MNALIGVLIGGAISLLATIATDVLRARHNRRHMIDHELLTRMSEFVAAGHEVIGDLHDRGVAKGSRTDDPDGFEEAKLRARESTDRLRVARGCALMVNQGRRLEINGFMESINELRDLVEAGFEKSDIEWQRLRDALSDKLEEITLHVMADLKGT